jgi:hypothetical protein
LGIFRTVSRAILAILSPPLMPRADQFVTAVVTALDRAISSAAEAAFAVRTYALDPDASEAYRFLTNRTKPLISENSPLQFAATHEKFVRVRAAVEHFRGV